MTKAYKSRITIKNPDVRSGDPGSQISVPLEILPDKAPFVICWTNEKPSVPPPSYDNGIQTEANRKQLIIDILNNDDKTKYAQIINLLKKSSTIISISWVELRKSNCEDPNFPTDKDKFPPIPYTDSFDFPLPEELPEPSDEPQYPAPPQPADQKPNNKLSIVITNPQDIESCEEKIQQTFFLDTRFSITTVEQLKQQVLKLPVPETYNIEQRENSNDPSAVNVISFNMSMLLSFYIIAKIEHNIQLKSKIIQDKLDQGLILITFKAVEDANTSYNLRISTESDINATTISREKIRTKILEAMMNINFYENSPQPRMVRSEEIEKSLQKLIDDPKKFLGKSPSIISSDLRKKKDSLLHFFSKTKLRTKPNDEFKGCLIIVTPNSAQIDFVPISQFKNTPCCIKVVDIRQGIILHNNLYPPPASPDAISIKDLKIFRSPYEFKSMSDTGPNY